MIFYNFKGLKTLTTLLLSLLVSLLPILSQMRIKIPKNPKTMKNSNYKKSD